MKKYLFIFLFFFSSGLVNAQDKNILYYLDVDKLLNKSNHGKEIILKLKKINNENITLIENYEREIKKDDEELNKVKNLISEDEFNNKIFELKKKISNYRDSKDKIFEDYKNLKNKELEVFFKTITPIIEEYMKINEIELILDKKNIFIANSKYDITEKLIEYINIKLEK